MPGVLGNILEYKGGQGCPSGMKWVSIWGTNSLKGVLKETEETIGLLGDLMGGCALGVLNIENMKYDEIMVCEL